MELENEMLQCNYRSQRCQHAFRGHQKDSIQQTGLLHALLAATPDPRKSLKSQDEIFNMAKTYSPIYFISQEKIAVYFLKHSYIFRSYW